MRAVGLGFSLYRLSVSDRSVFFQASGDSGSRVTSTLFRAVSNYECSYPAIALLSTALILDIVVNPKP